MVVERGEMVYVLKRSRQASLDVALQGFCMGAEGEIERK